MKEFFESLSAEFDISQNEIYNLSPLVLAYIGDAVYETFIRTMLVCSEKLPVHRLHRRSIDFVKAKAQSDIVHRISDFLTPEEQDVLRRGRNAKSGTIPKNADVTEYKRATGFEAVIGYLYLKKDQARLLEVLRMSIQEEEHK